MRTNPIRSGEAIGTTLAPDSSEAHGATAHHELQFAQAESSRPVTPSALDKLASPLKEVPLTSGFGATVSSRRATQLAQLPAPLIREIAAKLRRQDMVRLAMVGRETYDILKDERERARFTLDVRNILSLEDVQERLRSIQNLVPIFRRGPLTALAGQINWLGSNQRQTAFNGVLEAATQLPVKDRTELLATLRDRFADLPDVHKCAAFDGVLAATAQLPKEHRATPLKALSESIIFLPAGQRQAGFSDVLAATGQLPKEHRATPLQALSQLIIDLPKEQWQAAVSNVLAATGQLPEERQAMPLAALAEPIVRLPDEPRQAALNHVFAATGQLRVEHRAASLKALAQSISYLPDEHRQVIFNRVAAATGQLAEEHPVALLPPAPLMSHEGLLTWLARRIRALPSGQRGAALSAVLAVIGRLPMEHQTLPLRSLESQIDFLPYVEQSGARVELRNLRRQARARQSQHAREQSR
ncbi:hypothetical protein FSO04_41510 [Paraburkholderia madseniana]|uniref:F-box domain-containing protein n=1 Tax=Paraburkholderia madseniana TaxID=2599607 RepID=A0A6N6W0A0_9BURK|nr:hypothetical protein [Paraburkholderia madseniana]KAE8754107.1 hypothetical protein FSO04_41510 [Paraburkholderia madseniana]